LSYSGTFRLTPWLVAAGFALSGTPAHAEEALPVQAALAVAAVETPDSLAAAPAGAGVYLEQPVGSVVIGEAGEDSGRARYALRAGGEGSGDVRFSTRRPRPGQPEVASATATATTGRVVGSAPAGLPIGGRLTSQFGSRINPVSGAQQHHAGIDLAAATGSPVATTGNGVVRFAGYAGNYGLLVVVDHGGGVESRYAHLSRLAVSRGQSVTRGQAVGLVGSTGRSTGPHLHYEVRANGRALNPLRH
jgi:murein DD-endopeptidase MepM/ murein hydrolase activator NlpD